MSWIAIVCLSLVVLAIHLDVTAAADRKSPVPQSVATVQKPARHSPENPAGASLQHTGRHAKAGPRRGGRLAIPARTTKKPTTIKVITMSTRATTLPIVVPTEPPACDPCTAAHCPSGQGYPDCGECEMGGGTWSSADRSTCFW